MVKHGNSALLATCAAHLDALLLSSAAIDVAALAGPTRNDDWLIGLEFSGLVVADNWPRRWRPSRRDPSWHWRSTAGSTWGQAPRRRSSSKPRRINRPDGLDCWSVNWQQRPWGRGSRRRLERHWRRSRRRARRLLAPLLRLLRAQTPRNLDAAGWHRRRWPRGLAGRRAHLAAGLCPLTSLCRVSAR